ncbi:ribonuclease Z [Paraconexibacter antarcticus]|uniref:Ribonuclease Z n=1 Tax=Paraconexibacter antarcticus TaxID=2949664 RepID=A0ABY5DMG2_9ACTN|nr:ribonuclease Z [Paraconexibacter antarcticus]UTI62734.1 ribonuclease Z [Paraconexibacter antarcticus]
MDLSLFFAGTAGSVPTPRRGLPAVLLRRGGDRILFDCGEGTQRQLSRSIGLTDVDVVFLTHFHADHWLGLPGMLKSFALRDRTAPLALYGPPGIRQLVAQLKFVLGTLPFPFTVTELEAGEAVEFGDYEISSFNVRHRGVAFGYCILEDDRPGRFDAELAASLGVAPGPDFGRLQRGETVDGVTPEQVMGPGRYGRKIVLSGDTAPCEALADAAHHADLLVHEATFLAADADRAATTRHSTATQAALTAKEADVGLLALVHLSGRYPGRAVLDEARETFERTVLPRDFDHIDVPFPEKGDPELVRWEPPARIAP